ncbi:MAG: DUF5683 domain-containing protein [Bacteroidales bacterium]
MKKWINIYLLTTLVFIGQTIIAQNPEWTYKLPKADNSSFYYEIAKGVGQTMDDAKEKMYFDIKTKIAEKLGMPSEVKISSSSQMSSTGEISLQINNNVNGNLQYTIPMRRVCDYLIRLKDGSYASYGLYQVAQYGNIKVDFENYTKCNKMSSNYAGLWRSAIVPGWGQIHKGEKVKGYIFLGSEVVLVGTALYFHNEYQVNIKKSHETTNINIQKAFRDIADNKATYRNVAIIGAASVYVWNLIDAVVNSSGTKSNFISKNLNLEIDRLTNTPLLSYTAHF